MRKSRKRNTITATMPVKHVIITGLISMEANDMFEKLLSEVKNGKDSQEMKLISIQGN